MKPRAIGNTDYEIVCSNSLQIDYLFDFWNHGLAFLDDKPAFRVIRATPESMTEMPYSSDLEWDL